MENGDLVRTELGRFAYVVRVEGGNRVGCSYIGDESFPSLNVFTLKRDELKVVKSKLGEFWNEIFQDISNEERRLEIMREREIRTTQPTSQEKVIKRNFSIDQLMKEMSEGELNALKEMIREKGGKI